MHVLLRVLLEYWDLMRLLLRSYERLRKQRKQLLSVLPSLFKAVAQLQEDHLTGMHCAAHRTKIDNAIKTVVLKAFQVVAKGAHFLDILETLHGPTHKASITVAGRTYHFPSPPGHEVESPGAQPEKTRPAFLERSTLTSTRLEATSPASVLPTNWRPESIIPTGPNKNFPYCELVYGEGGKVVGGTFVALVAKLTAHEAVLDWSFVSTFYLTFRFFASPVQFANTLLAQFEENPASTNAKSCMSSKVGVYGAFSRWLGSYWRDDLDQGAIPAIQRFASKVAREYPEAEPLLRSKIEAKLSIGKPTVVRSANLLILNSSRTETNFERPMKTKEIILSVLQFNSLQFARQLTITTSAIFCLIKDEELFGQEWTKRSESNVKAVIAFSTSLSHLVADDIMQHEKPLKRAMSIKRWIEIADRCTGLQNYESSMAIIASLNFASIGRLKKSWELVPADDITIFQSLTSKLSTKNNYEELRKLQGSSNRPCLPYLGLYLKDLTFTGDGNPDTKTMQGLNGTIAIINFDKYLRMAKIVRDLQYLQVPYQLTPSLEIYTWLQRQVSRVRLLSDWDVEDWLYRESERLEPREAVQPRLTHADHGLVWRIQYKFSTLTLRMRDNTT
ncbi:hypothetical protein IFR05_014664 [Cadophora sp. M221]|nr:hypothetical protein IFR05_014664 [Cadophora sp. M221]